MRFANGPRLSPEKGAKVVPKVPCFPGRPVSRSPRSRAPAPQVLESSIVLPFSGGGPTGAATLTVKHVTLAMRDVTFPIVLRIPAENDDFARDPLQIATGNHGILDRATGPPKELVLIYKY